MRYFVIRDQLSVMFLAGSTQAGALLGFRRQKGIRGDVEEAGPALPESSRNLRNAEIMKRKRAAERFVKTDRGIDFLA